MQAPYADPTHHFTLSIELPFLTVNNPSWQRLLPDRVEAYRTLSALARQLDIVSSLGDGLNNQVNERLRYSRNYLGHLMSLKGLSEILSPVSEVL